MESQSNRHSLPRVTLEDVSAALVEDIIEPTHDERWLRFATEQPELAREILSRAKIIPKETHESYGTTKAAIDLTTFAIDSIHKAIERSSQEAVTSDDVDDAVNQQP